MEDGAAIHVVHARPVVRAGLAALLRSDRWQVTTHDERPDVLARADIVVADYAAGIALARAGAARPVLVVTGRDKEWDVRRALECGVAGYLLADTGAAQLREAVRQLLAGARHLCPVAAARLGLPAQRLTGRESDVLHLLARGLCNKRIARDLGIEVGTVKWHVRSLMGKLGANARTQAVVVAAQRGLVGFDTAGPGLSG
ncbi:response regulator transcription factor [uncultured Massilia sp.]|uniref:LuxR C-terminal-related transcriptional regulator n=1 Tax=uncultured Massilia sp. TaxID=169973 RepID=UPI0025CF89DC|nr:response regulator transcription factor [uncultured Massilia sp.]